MKDNTNIAQNTNNRKLFQQNFKPQISSIPGVSPKEKHRYRVTLNGQVLDTHLTFEEAVLVAGMGGAL